MKLRIASDFHLEFYDYHSLMSHNGRDMNENYIVPKIDDDEKEQVLVLAGDICAVSKISRYQFFFEALSKRFKHIVIIMGNHEHYGNDFYSTYKKLTDFYSQFKNVSLLEKESILIDDVLFFGATLWTDFHNDMQAMAYARYGMMDYKCIEGNLSPTDTMVQHIETVAALEEFILNKNTKKVIMTHHGPSSLSISPKYAGSPLNPAFISHLDSLVERSGAAYWIHGHVHQNFNYKIGKTKVVCNPFGYWNENPEFNPHLVLTI